MIEALLLIAAGGAFLAADFTFVTVDRASIRAADGRAVLATSRAPTLTWPQSVTAAECLAP